MCSVYDLIEKAKSEIEEDVEFILAPVAIETGMQERGVMAMYDFNHDIIYYSSTLIKSRSQDYQIQIFMHELAHAKDLRGCAKKGLLKILIPHKRISKRDWEKAKEDLHAATEFQVSNFLYSKYHITLPKCPKTDRDLADDLFFSLIPAIEYISFGEAEDLRDQFKLKLNKSLDNRWLSVASLLNSLGFADIHLFETRFIKLAKCFGFTIQMKNESITEEIRNSFKIFQNNDWDGYIKIFELIDFDIRRSIFINTVS